MIAQKKAYWSVPSSIRCFRPQGIYEYCLRAGLKFFSLEEAMQEKCGGVYEIEFDGREPKSAN